MSVPFAGSLFVSVEAETEEEAREKVWETNCRISVKNEGDDAFPYVELGEWDIHEKLIEGNICHANQTEITVDEVEEFDEE